MNSIAIDCATSRLSVAAKKDSFTVKSVLDIGIRQSEKLLPAIDYVMKEIELKPSDLDYTTLTLGPGTFTGLRLGLSTLKSLTLSHDIPVYGIPSLDAYSYDYRNSRNRVLSLIEAKEDEFFLAIYANGNKILQDDDKTIDEILSLFTDEDEITVCGPGASNFIYRAREISPLIRFNLLSPFYDGCSALFELTEQKIKEGIEPLKDYDGPIYVRKSEAEIVYEKKHQS